MKLSDFPPDSGAPRKPRRGRALLVAAVGVATMTYGSLQTGCGNGSNAPPTSGNLLVPPAMDAGPHDAGAGDAGDADVPVSGNLLPPPDAGNVTDAMPSSGNLMPPPEAGPADGSVSDAGADSGTPTSRNLVPPPALHPTPRKP